VLHKPTSALRLGGREEAETGELRRQPSEVVLEINGACCGTSTAQLTSDPSQTGIFIIPVIHRGHDEDALDAGKRYLTADPSPYTKTV